MNVDYKVVKKCLVLTIGAEFDHHEAKKIKSVTEHLMRRGVTKHIILDFRNTKFMDSSGIGMIISRYKEVNLRGGKISIINAAESVKKLILISGLHKLVYEYDCLDDALMELY